MCLNTGTPKNINFSFETNGKLMALGVPILKHFRVPLYFAVDFGVSAQLDKTIGRRNTFIGTPYW